jgi:hypothetical protein
VLEHVREHDRVGARRQAFDLFEIGDDDMIEAGAERAGAVDVVLEADGAVEALAQRRTELTAGGDEVE